MKIFVYIFSSYLFFGCGMQKNKYDFNLSDTMFETFNYSEFEKQNKKYQGIDDDGFEEEFTFDDGTKVLADQEEMFILPKTDFYVGYKAFYENGNIKEKGHYFGIFELNVKSIKIGKWFYFDEKGNLIKTVDEEKKLGKFNSQEVLKFLSDRNYINLKNGKNRENIEIEFFHSPDYQKRLWIITVYKGKSFFISGNESSREGKYFHIDANTGQEIKFNEVIKYRDIIPNFEEIYPSLVSNILYRTHNNKTYTEEEWKIFEEQEYQKYVANKNKKGFWDKLFGD